MSHWLQRMARRLEKWAQSHGPGHQQSEAVKDTFFKRSLYGDTRSFFEALLVHFPEGQPLDEGVLHLLVAELRGVWGAEKAVEEGELPEHILFWKTLSERSGNAYATACYGDTLLAADRDEEAVQAFLLAFQSEPLLCVELGDDLEEHASRLGDPAWLDYQLAQIRCALAGGGNLEPDELRERYSELLEDYASDFSSLERVRQVGADIAAAEERGDLPRVMVLRGRSRTQN